MRYLLLLFLLTVSLPIQAKEWPRSLEQKTYDGCRRYGGESQCKCVVFNLQQKFSFEDMALTRNNPLAKEALNQMLSTYNMMCLQKGFKQKTYNLMQEKKELKEQK